MALPTDPAARKAIPLFTGVLLYFPDALAAVAEVSRMGNEQHNPGEPLHWAREKSTDQMNTALRHMVDNGTGTLKDTDGAYHLAKAAWRILAELQLTIEAVEAGPTPPMTVPLKDTDFPIGWGGGPKSCGHYGGRGWLCERPMGHTGKHKAWDFHPRRDGEQRLSKRKSWRKPKLHKGGVWS